MPYFVKRPACIFCETGLPQPFSFFSRCFFAPQRCKHQLLILSGKKNGLPLISKRERDPAHPISGAKKYENLSWFQEHRAHRNFLWAKVCSAPFRRMMNDECAVPIFSVICLVFFIVKTYFGQHRVDRDDCRLSVSVRKKCIMMVFVAFLNCWWSIWLRSVRSVFSTFTWYCWNN